MIKNIIFDLGNVILGYDKERVAREFTSNIDEIKFIKEKIFDSPEWELLDLGIITNDEAIQIISKKEDPKYAKLIDVFFHEWYKVQSINKDTINIAKQLKERGYNIFVLSNMAKETYEYFKDLDFFKLSTGIVISAYENIKKPDEKIFKILLERYNLKPEDCLFIDDDDTGKSYDISNRLGIKGRRVKPNDSKDVLKLLKENDIECSMN